MLLTGFKLQACTCFMLKYFGLPLSGCAVLFTGGQEENRVHPPQLLSPCQGTPGQGAVALDREGALCRFYGFWLGDPRASSVLLMAILFLT